MNERIRELALQAKHRLDQDIKDGKKDWKNTPQSYDEMVQEKFAELIVKECIDIAQDRANFPGYPPNDVNDIIDEIREHFGVEE